MMSDLLIARTSAMVRLDGTPYRVRRGRTVAHADSTIAWARPELWRPIVVDYPAAPAAGDSTQAAPAPKAVRAWAKTEGIEVPARGPLPAELVERYQAAQGEA